MSRAMQDVVVAGGGVAGAAAALALARAGFEVTVVEPREPPAWTADEPLDLRVFALAPSSARLLDDLGVWRDVLSARASAYTAMRVVDAANGAGVSFQAADTGRAALGWIVEDRLLRHVLWQALRTAGVRRVASHALRSDTDSGRIRLQLADGETLSARLALAAEGGASPLRESAGIACDGRDYHACGVVAHVRCEHAHEGTAWQRFLPGGPLALLPLADGRVSVVWTLPVDAARRMQALDAAAFLDELGVATDFRFGRVLETTSRAAFPLRLQLAQRYRAGRLLLLGDAAHVVHPLAGQGINLGLRDVAELRDVLLDARRRDRDLGADDVLERFARRRRSVATLDGRAFDALERLYAIEAAPLSIARGLGLRLLDRMPPLKRMLVAHAAGD